MEAEESVFASHSTYFTLFPQADIEQKFNDRTRHSRITLLTIESTANFWIYENEYRP